MFHTLEMYTFTFSQYVASCRKIRTAIYVGALAVISKTGGERHLGLLDHNALEFESSDILIINFKDDTHTHIHAQ